MGIKPVTYPIGWYRPIGYIPTFATPDFVDSDKPGWKPIVLTDTKPGPAPRDGISPFAKRSEIIKGMKGVGEIIKGAGDVLDGWDTVIGVDRVGIRETGG